MLWLSLCVFTGAHAQYTSLDNNDGLWTDNATWVGGTAPAVNGISDDITIYGTVSREGDIGYDDGLLTVNDTLLIYGNITLENDADLEIGSDGVFIVYGDYTAKNKVEVSTGGTFVVLGDFRIQGSSNQGGFDNSGTVYIPNPVRVPDGGGYTDLDCDDPDDYPDNCAYGNQEDLEEDPIWEIVAAGGYKIKSDGPNEFCLGDSVRLWIAKPADSYQWILNGSDISGATGSEYYAKTGGDYTAQVINGTDTFSLAAITVTVYTPSVIPDSAYSSDSVICSGNPANITISYGGGSLGIGATAMWYDDAGLTSNIGSGNDLSIAAPIVATTYYVRFEGQCDSTAAVSTTVNVGTTPSPAISGNETTCVPGQEIYTVTGDPGSSFSWVVTGGIINGSSVGSTVTVDWAGTGTGNIEVTEVTSVGCLATDNIDVEKLDAPSVGVISSTGTLTRR